MLLLLPALLAVQTTPLDAFRGNIAAIHARNRAACDHANAARRVAMKKGNNALD